MLQTAAWLASRALRISHAMSAGTSLAPHEKKPACAGIFGISGGDGEFAYMLQAAAWLASQALRISHAMSARKKARLRGLLDISGRDGVETMPCNGMARNDTSQHILEMV